MSTILVLPNLSLAQEQTPRMEPPETIEEAKELGWRFFEICREQLLGIIEGLWRGRVLPVWRQMYQIWSNFWDSYIQPWLQGIWNRVLTLFGQEIERRRPQIEEEFEKEKEEIREETQKAQKTLWDRFKELIE